MPEPTPAWPERPNILSISFEDCTPWFGCYGHPVRTPNVDRLAAEGAMWPNAFTPAPVCSPTRSAVMTGMYPVSIGTHHMRTITYRDQGMGGYEAVVPHYVRCYPEYLRAAGYWCCNDGKHDYQFTAPVTVWDQTSNPWMEDGTAHWRNRPDPDMPFLAQFNLGASHESQSWENSQFDDAHLEAKVQALLAHESQFETTMVITDDPENETAAFRESEFEQMRAMAADQPFEFGEAFRLIEDL